MGKVFIAYAAIYGEEEQPEAQRRLFEAERELFAWYFDHHLASDAELVREVPLPNPVAPPLINDHDLEEWGGQQLWKQLASDVQWVADLDLSRGITTSPTQSRYPEDELDWDAVIEPFPPNSSGTIKVRLEYGGRSKPPPLDEP